MCVVWLFARRSTCAIACRCERKRRTWLLLGRWGAGARSSKHVVVFFLEKFFLAPLSSLGIFAAGSSRRASEHCAAIGAKRGGKPSRAACWLKEEDPRSWAAYEEPPEASLPGASELPRVWTSPSFF